MNINFSRVPQNRKEGLLEAACQLGISEKEQGGIPLFIGNAEKLTVSYDGEAFRILFPSLNQLYRGLRLLKEKFEGRKFSYTEICSMKELGIMLDCSRNAVRTVDFVKELIRLLALMGYNQLQLYMEDTYEIEGEPYFGYLRGRYTKQELKELDGYAAKFGVELVPNIQTLAHLNQIFRWGAYRDINDIADILLVDEEKTYALIDKMFSTMAECFSSRKIHIGMDEASRLGRGKYEDKHGPAFRRDIMLKHIGKVVKIAEKYSFEPMMWSDMFFRIAFGDEYYDCSEREIDKKIADLIPEKLRLLYWDYNHTDPKIYEIMIKKHISLGCELEFAGGAWMWTGFAPSNGFSIRTMEAALPVCEKYNIDKVMLALWGDDGAECSALAVLPTLSRTAELAYGNNDYKKAFLALTDIAFDDFIKIDLANVVDERGKTINDNPAKYMLYNDCLYGLFDYIVEKGDGEIYAHWVDALKKVEQTGGRYAYLFKTQKVLCEILFLKYELGVKTHSYYKSQNREGLKKLADEEYRILAEKIQDFAKAFEEQWYCENKPFGFEVQDYRLGGLLRRVDHCRRRLLQYAEGQISDIPEMEVEFLDPFETPNRTVKSVNFNSFGKSIGTNILSK